jgi:hypothetical protein
MNSNSTDLEADLEDWLKKQPIWLQHAAQSLLAGRTSGPEQITDFAKMAISEVKQELAAPESPLPVSTYGVHASGSVSLQSISNVTGIGRLKPRNPLNFGSEKISVIYGSNAAGKSSYVRILKHACGAREKGDIHPNIYENSNDPQGCTITFSDGSTSRSIDWKLASGVVSELSTIDIFDSHCGRAYLTSEGKSSYEPPALLFLSELAALCDKVADKLSAAMDAKVKALPLLLPEHVATDVGRWYQGLTARTEQTAIDKNCTWTDSDDEELVELEKYITERSPKDRAKEWEVKKGFIDGIVTSLNDHLAALSDGGCKVILDLRKAVQETQKTAELAAKINVQDAVLDGVGTTEWLNLWSYAQTYSTQMAYPELPFPHIDEDARCVLCQQELSEVAIRRLSSFEKYVTDETAAAAKNARDALKTAIDQMPALPDKETLEAKAAGAGLSESATISLTQFYAQLSARRDLLIGDDLITAFGEYPETADWINNANLHSEDCAAKAKQFLEGFSEEDRNKKIKSHKELTARKWIAVQKSAVETEIKRLIQIAVLSMAKELCGTRAISLKKGAIAEALITPGYIEAFNRELKRLGAKRVRVSLVRTRVERGVILHQIKLRDALRDKPIHDILSEGEHRIVCIAAFLADVSAKPNGSTFVFDDPISSLDLEYEEAVVRRLVQLSNSRQVIVFTHRLSLLGMVQDEAKKSQANVKIVHIRSEPWGTGEPGDESVDSAKPKAILNDLLPRQLREAKVIFDESGWDAYQAHAQSICTNIRKVIERTIEVDLLGDVIQRHRRAINTLGKIDKLADITPEDCKFVDEMMTKYSRYEHAQSDEAPVTLPEPDELLEDITNLKKWRDGIDARRK